MSDQSMILPLLALRDIIIFPHMVVPLFVGREKSVKALEAADKSNPPQVMLAAQRDAKTHHPGPDDIYRVGTIGEVMQMMKLADGTVKVLVRGEKRARIDKFVGNDAFFEVGVTELKETVNHTPELAALMRSVVSSFEQYVKLGKKISPEVVHQIQAIEDPFRLADTLIVHFNVKIEEKQDVLEIDLAEEKLEKILTFMKSEIEILQVERKIRTRVKKQMEKTQKEYYLNEQMRAIQKELGEKDDFRNEVQELEDKLKEKNMPEEALEKTEREIRKLKMMSPMSAEATVVRNYIDWMLSLPWKKYSEDKINMKTAEEVLEADHYGLSKVKERILEYLAVQKLVGELKGPILCLVGPPGVGKTSLGRSVARATGREFVRIALGGVRDEAEVRGHRRTYIGALPGKIIQSLKRAGTSNPVFLLDEVDKMSADFRGDPSSALLEVLDPEQNDSFNDHYLDVDYDLSKVMFITTANSDTTIPGPLLDRMEVIKLTGYTELEKLQIARRYLLPKNCEKNGIKKNMISIGDDSILSIIRHYTREAGVRNLERTIAKICRKVAVYHVKGQLESEVSEVKPDNLDTYLGVHKFRFGIQEEQHQIGTATGLAWTQVGGDVLVIEVAIATGKGRLIITGKLGDVMQESARAAMMYVRSRAHLLGLPRHFYSKVDLHIHVPEGAIPKDGPSAGVTMMTAIASALTGIPVNKNIAMTGEITLRGRVIAIGGLKEKILAAHRAGCTKILIPSENEKDIEEIPTSVREGIEIVAVNNADEVLREALIIEGPEKYANLLASKEIRYKELFEDSPKEETLVPPLDDGNEEAAGVVRH